MPFDPNDHLYDQVEQTIQEDDVDNFRYVVDLCVEDQSKPWETFIPGYLTIFGAIKCAKLVLAGETPYKMDFNIRASPFRLPLLHLAASSSAKLLDLYIQHGASPNLRCVCDNDKTLNGMLPINIALESIRTAEHMGCWTPDLSVFNLLIRLSLLQLRGALETVKLLVGKTEQIEEEIYCYAKQGRLVELAALLMAAHEKVLSPSLFPNISASSVSDLDLDGGISLRQFVTAEIALLTAVELRLGNKNNDDEALKTCKNKKLEMTSLLLLLEVFERAGPSIASYLELERSEVPIVEKLAQEVAWILTEAGFTLKAEDLELGYLDRFTVTPCEYSYNTDYVTTLDNASNLDVPQCLEEDWFWLHNQVETMNDSKGCKRNEVQSTNDSRGCERNEMKMLYEQWRASGHTSYPTELNNTIHFIKETPSICCLNGKSSSNGLLQLRTAINRFCNHQYLRDWSPEKSIFQLVYMLCCHELRERLKHIQSLACNIEEVSTLGCYYVKEGKVIELTTLLMVAREKLIPVIGSQSTDGISFGDSFAIRRVILRETQNLIDEEIRLVGVGLSEDMCKCKNRQVVMLSALLLVEVFERAGDVIEKYIQSHKYQILERIVHHSASKRMIAENISKLLKQLGFVLKREDTLLTDFNL